MNVFSIAAAGGVGRRLVALLTRRGDQISGMHRKPEQSAVIAATGATPVTGDLIADSVGELARKLCGHDVWCSRRRARHWGRPDHSDRRERAGEDRPSGGFWLSTIWTATSNQVERVLGAARISDLVTGEMPVWVRAQARQAQVQESLTT